MRVCFEVHAPGRGLMMTGLMTSKPLRDRGSPAVARPALFQPKRTVPVLPLSLWGVLAITAMWRLALASQVANAPAHGLESFSMGPGAAIVHWRQLDGFIGWVALLIWLIGVGSGGALGGATLKARRISTLLGILAGVGVVITAAAMLWDQAGTRQSAFAGVGEQMGHVADEANQGRGRVSELWPGTCLCVTKFSKSEVRQKID